MTFFEVSKLSVEQTVLVSDCGKYISWFRNLKDINTVAQRNKAARPLSFKQCV